MADEKDPNASIAYEAASSTTPAASADPMSTLPRPHGVLPRPAGGPPPPPSRMPPPPSSRGIGPGAGAPRSTVPPPPQRSPASSPMSSGAASPGIMPRPPATPPPPPQRPPTSPVSTRPSTLLPQVSVTAQLEQRLAATQVELRKLGSERHTLRARLRRETDRLRELESALRAEKGLRAQASDEHFAAILGMRSRLAELEVERVEAGAASRAELARTRAELEQARGELEQARAELERARSGPLEWGASGGAGARPSKIVRGLRRIRGIGPAYQRVLEQAGISRVQQIAGWTERELSVFADKLRIRRERILKDDWIGQAKLLEPDP